MKKNIFALLLFFVLFQNTNAQNDGLYAQKEVIYGHKNGMALTMFVTTPAKANNHRAILYLASGGYYSETKWIPEMTEKASVYLERGYTVFIVLHGSAPLYSSIEAIPDIQRAVQFVRYNAKEYQIDPDHIGMTGNSSGGNLSLLAGTTEAKSNDANADAVAKVSSKVQVVACFYPPTDFLNYRKPDNPVLTDTTAQRMIREGWILSAFAFKKLNPENNTYSFVQDDTEKLTLYKKLSPIYNVDKTTAVTLIYHGDKDVLVPIYQSETFIKKLESFNIPCRLLVKKGGGHGWDHEENERKVFADWFDEKL